jgi:hypothetical protein
LLGTQPRSYNLIRVTGTCLVRNVKRWEFSMKKLLFIVLLVPSICLSQTNGGTLSGRIRWSDGSIAPRLRVALVPIGAAERRVEEALQSESSTDDSGAYRLDGIPAGQYYVVAGHVGRLFYLPGVLTMKEATVITVVDGTGKSDLDFRMANSTFMVSGKVVGVPPRTVAGTFSAVTLIPSPAMSNDPSSSGVKPASAMLKDDGTFEIPDVVAGTYRVRFLSTSPDANFFAEIPTIVVDRDTANIELVSQRLDVPTPR